MNIIFPKYFKQIGYVLIVLNVISVVIIGLLDFAFINADLVLLIFRYILLISLLIILGAGDINQQEKVCRLKALRQSFHISIFIVLMSPLLSNFVPHFLNLGILSYFTLFVLLQICCLRYQQIVSAKTIK